MPKISTKEIKVFHKDVDKHFQITIYYNSSSLFYCKLPEGFKELVETMSREDKKAIGLSIILNSRGKPVSLNGKTQYGVRADSENEVWTKVNKVIKELLTRAITKRPVIILFYDGDREVRFNNHKHNREHPQINVIMGLTYAQETSVGDSKTYAMIEEHERIGGEKYTRRKDISLWNSAATIIDDTPENRASLEALYSAFKNLNEKLTEFTKDESSLLKLIESNVKLLN